MFFYSTFVALQTWLLIGFSDVFTEDLLFNLFSI